MSDHDPNHDPNHDDNNPEIYGRNARVGMVLFVIYLALYGGFVYLSAYQRATMGTLYLGVNLALWYGMGLILAALVLAGIYMAMCRR